MRWFGVSQSTDLYHRDTVIKKFTSKAAAIRWRDAPGNGSYTYPGAVGDDIPARLQNHHHTHRRVYVVESSIELSRRSATRVWRANRQRDRWASSSYSYTIDDELASMIYKHGKEVDDER